MFVAVLTALLAFSVAIFFAARIVREKTAEQKRVDEEEKKAKPD
jgi:hypothetical protein